MKTIRIAAAFVAVLSVCSCAKEFDVNNAKDTLTLRVSNEIPQSDGKAALSGSNVIFNAGDAICVYDGTSMNKFTTTQGGQTASFSGEAASSEKYVVISPYKEDYTVNGSVVRAEIPDVQTAVSGGVDPMALVSAGNATTLGSIQLYNMVGLVKVEVPDGLVVKEIQIGGGYGQNTIIAGFFDFNTNEKTVAPVTDKGKTVIHLVPAAGKTVIDPGVYYIAARPKSTYDNGFTVAYVNADNQLCKRQTKTAADIKRSHILPVGALNTTDYTAVTGIALLRTSGDEVQFTGRIKKLAGGTGTATASDSAIKRIVFKAHCLYSQAYKTATNLVSSGSGQVEIHAVYENGTVYVYSEGSAITLQAASGSLFRDFASLESVEFNDVTTQANTSFDYLFRNDFALKNVAFGNCDFSKVTNMSFMFVNIASLENVDFGNTSTGSVTTFKGMFSGCTNVLDLKFGPNFDVSHITDNSMVNNMFYDTAKGSNQAAGDDPTKKCHLYMTQALYDALSTGDYSNSALNKARFYFVPLISE